MLLSVKLLKLFSHSHVKVLLHTYSHSHMSHGKCQPRVIVFFVVFMLYVPVNNYSVISRWAFLGLTITTQILLLNDSACYESHT